MLSKKVKLTVTDYSAKLSSPLKFYKNDSVYLIFEIVEFGIKYTNGRSRIGETPIVSLYGKLLVETPYGVDSIKSMENSNDNIFMFHLDTEYTQNIGRSKMQIVLLDDDGVRYKITLPEIEFEIKKSINEKWDGEDVVYPTIILTDDGNLILADDETALIK